MTTIVCTRQGMAADKRAICGVDFKTSKIHRVGGSLVAYAGDADMGIKFVNWKRGGEKPDFTDETEISALELTSTGQIIFYTARLEPHFVENDFYGIGTGAQYALGAMSAGATMEEAVAIAMKWDSGSGGGIQTAMLQE